MIADQAERADSTWWINDFILATTAVKPATIA
jgi:hypothetical protein